MFVVETVPRCVRTRFLVFALEECEASYELELHEPGSFAQRGAIGPWLRDGPLVLTEINLALTHVAEAARRLVPDELAGRREVQRWLELQATWMRPAGARVHGAARRGTRDEDAEDTLSRCLRQHDAALREREYLAGAFSLADCTAPYLLVLEESTPVLEGYPALRAYLARVRRRPALLRSEARCSASDAPHPSISRSSTVSQSR